MAIGNAAVKCVKAGRVCLRDKLGVVCRKRTSTATANLEKRAAEKNYEGEVWWGTRGGKL